MTVNESTESNETAAAEPTSDGVLVTVTVRVRNHGTPFELFRAYQQYAQDSGRDPQDAATVVDALQSLPAYDVSAVAFTVGGLAQQEQAPQDA